MTYLEGLHDRQPLAGEGIFALPADIDQEDWFDFLAFMYLYKSQPVRIVCTSNGGNFDVSMGMAQMIKNHGNVEGYLLGDAGSMASVIFAACPVRYAYGSSSMTLHSVGVFTEGRATYGNAHGTIQGLHSHTVTIARIYALASSKPVQDWVRILNWLGNHTQTLEYPALLEIGMVRPMPMGGGYFMNEVMDWIELRKYPMLDEDTLHYLLRVRGYRLDNSRALQDACFNCGKPTTKESWQKPAFQRGKRQPLYFQFRCCRHCGRVIR